MTPQTLRRVTGAVAIVRSLADGQLLGVAFPDVEQARAGLAGVAEHLYAEAVDVAEIRETYAA